jgi:putative PIN family toxin of toxin-antitoxin system
VRVVLDTNVIVSALLWGGVPEKLIEAAGEGALELVTTEALLAELDGILRRPKFAERLARSNLDAKEILALYRALAEVVEAPPVDTAGLRDPDDEAVLACARAGHAQAIVTGDADLHALGQFQDIPILTPAQALGLIARS